MPESIDSAIQRSKSYWLRDGIPEIVLGVYFALAGLLFAMEAALGEGGRSISAYGLPIVIVGGTLAAAPIIRALKLRITYPRTGYAVQRRTSTPHRCSAALVSAVATIAVAAAVVLFAEGSSPAGLPLAPLLTGAILSAGFLVAGLRSSQPRLFLVAVAASTSVAVCMSVVSDDTIGLAALFVAVGVVQGLLGVIALSRFLGQAPVAVDADAPDEGGETDAVRTAEPR